MATFRSVELRRPTTQGVTVDFHVDVTNPNAVSVPLKGADYKLALGGVQVVNDRIRSEGEVPAGGTLPLTIPVSLSFQDLFSAEQAIRASRGDVPYRFDGALDFSFNGAASLAGPVHLPLQFSGTLPLRELASDPMILLKSPAARQLVEWMLGRR